tara:strand:+ start:112 stop:975 length:864 start_codon:yes stop_codon:yes gene_type:complete
MFETSDLEKLQSIVGCFEKPKFSISGQFKDNIDSLILSDLWPNEVAPSLVVRNEQQIAVRAKSIAHSYGLHKMHGKKFLDFGCGNGAVVIEACKMGLFAFGYDHIKQWPDDVVLSQDLAHGVGNFNFSIDKDYILSNGPYDIISLYDVIDHIMTHDEAVEAMSFVRKCATPDAVINVRCHPWTSRHGGHLYETINRAYAHILLSEEEYQKHTSVKVRKITTPMNEYRSVFEKTGFTIDSIIKSTISIEPIFQTPQFVEKFRQKLDGDSDWQKVVLPITFADFVLKIR